ncbi:autoinducer 2 ABC transporter substrate-binding protein [Aeribacillus sp. FSL M8-0254]|uniref:autoinducer 2 ABC transporter substrate-binding protein n=1 Tax=Aeribacillus sp. FSL M8-0254 TaxID=2954577 RepID=UPI0030F8AD76
MNKTFKFFALAFFLFFLASCSLSKEYEVIYVDKPTEQRNHESNRNHEHEIVIGLVPKIANIPYFLAAKEGALEAAKDLNVTVIYKGPSAATAEEQIAVIHELIEQKVDVIAVSANDPKKLGTVLQQAREKGIKVITWDADTDAKYRDFFVNMVDAEQMGRHIMDLLALEMGERGKYVILTGSPTAANLNNWIRWLKVQQEEYYPELELLDVEYANEDIHKAYNLTVNLLKKYDDLKGIIGISTVNPPAIAQALKDYGKSGDIKVVGTSTPNMTRPYLKEDVLQTITLWSPQKLGYLTIALAKNLVLEDLPYDGQFVENIGNISFDGDMVIMGQPIDFTKENVDQYDF